MPSKPMVILHVDVFARTSLKGNPLAVLVPAEELSTEQMQRIANWLNLSETTLAKPYADHSGYSVRIFTPFRELPFAGHPSIGTAFALHAHGELAANQEQFEQHCGMGRLSLRRDGARFAIRTPKVAISDYDEAVHSELETILNTPLRSPVKLCDNGARWAVSEVESFDSLMALQCPQVELAQWNQRNGNLGLALFAINPNADEAVLEVRCFVPLDGIAEDPVTGSANAAIAAYLLAQQQIGVRVPARYVARQGRALGRDGYLHVHIDDHGEIWLAGDAHLVARGEFFFA